MKHVAATLLTFILMPFALGSVMQAMRDAQLTLPPACQHQFNTCAQNQGVLNLSKGNYCEATRAAEQCSLTSTDYHDEEGVLRITGVCTQAEFNVIERAACQGVTPPPNGGEEGEQPRPEPTVSVDTRRQFDQMDESCRNHTLTCFGLDPSNTTTINVDRALVCTRLKSVKDCLTGNPNNATTAPCTTEQYNALSQVACGACTLNSSMIIALFSLLIVVWAYTH